MLPPVVDPRDMKALIKQMEKMVPYYTPEWRFAPEDPEPGSALFLIFAEMFQEIIKRFNRLPIKNMTAFINMFGFPILPARPARAYVVFKLSMGAGEPVFISAGTQVAANAPGGKPVIFETERNMLATPAALVEVFNVSAKQDRISRIPEECLGESKKVEKPHFNLFDFTGANLQEHCMYLGHKSLFNIRGTALFELEFKNSQKRFKESSICEKLANPENVEWLYQGEAGWVAFDEMLAEGNRLTLKKTKNALIKEKEVDGIADRWICCKVKDRNVANISDVEIDGIGVSVEFYDSEDRGGITPDMIFYNDIQIDPAGFYPFGEYFVLYDNFYIASQEVLSKKDASVTVKFNLQHITNSMKDHTVAQTDWKLVMEEPDFAVRPKLTEVAVLTVSWEYWNGSGWVKLFSNRAYEGIFYKPDQTEKNIVFKLPTDIEETFVNEQLNYWIRARVISIQNSYAVDSAFRSPWIENIVLKYEFQGEKYPADCCLTYNNVEYRDRTEDVKSSGSSFEPFNSIDCRGPAFYMGFEQPPLKGPISMFFSIKQQKCNEGEAPLVEWEYLRGEGNTKEWSTLKTADETNGFTRSGTVTFVGPPDFKRDTIFGRGLYWLRVVNRDGRFDLLEKQPAVPIVKGIYMNSIRVVQQESIKNEVPELVTDELSKEYQLASYPVINEEIWVNEAGYLTGEEKKLLLDSELTKESGIKNNWDNTREFWVRWHAADDFFESGVDDRHYVIDRSSGRIRFGDGKYGKIPPSPGKEKIKVKYRIGGGDRGNVGPFDITNLQNSIAFVDEVFNPEPSGGGCDMETVTEALRRGPQMLKHRNRAVTLEDFEWLARQSSQNIARVKCLSNTNAQGKKETGCVTVVVLPKGGKAGIAVFPELKQQVERYLLERAAGTIAFPGKIQVIEPAFLEISVYAVLLVDEMDLVATTEKEAEDRLNEFLDPLTGDYEGNGWEIGQHPHISIFYALLKSISAVNYIEKVTMTVYKLEDGMRTEIDSNSLTDLPHGMVVNGKHRVIAKV